MAKMSQLLRGRRDSERHGLAPAGDPTAPQIPGHTHLSLHTLTVRQEPWRHLPDTVAKPP